MSTHPSNHDKVHTECQLTTRTAERERVLISHLPLYHDRPLSSCPVYYQMLFGSWLSSALPNRCRHPSVTRLRYSLGTRFADNLCEVVKLGIPSRFAHEPRDRHVIRIIGDLLNRNSALTPYRQLLHSGPSLWKGEYVHTVSTCGGSSVSTSPCSMVTSPASSFTTLKEISANGRKLCLVPMSPAP